VGRRLEAALVLDQSTKTAWPDSADAPARPGGLRCFRRTLELGYADDVDLMLQVGRSLFREGSLRDKTEFFDAAKEFFETAVQQVPDSAEAIACVGYTQHRLGDDDAAIGSLRRSLQLDTDHAEARIYLANILYDQSEYEAALYHFERTSVNAP
jgi:tetratricopeptide (TPR) repeat protein